MNSSINIDDLIAESETMADPNWRWIIKAQKALREQRDEIARLRGIVQANGAEKDRLYAGWKITEAERNAAMKVIEAAKAMRKRLSINTIINKAQWGLPEFDAALAELERK